MYEETACDLPTHGSEGQQGSFMLLSMCDPAACYPAEAAPAVRTTLQTILAILSGALQVIPLAGVHWVGKVMA